MLTFMHPYINSQGGRATLAMEVNGAEVVAGIAFASPKDQFNKKKGRMIATGRLSEHPNKPNPLRISYSIPEGKKLRETTSLVFKAFLDSGPVPRWAKGGNLLIAGLDF